MIIRAVKGARNQLVNLQELSDKGLKNLEQQFTRVREKAEQNVEDVHHGKAAESH